MNANHTHSSPSSLAPGFATMWHEGRRLLRRAHKKPFTVLLIASLATTGAVIRQAISKDRYEAGLTYRVVERTGTLPEGTRPLTKRRLREYIVDGIFTRTRCSNIIKRYQLYPEWRTISPDRAVESFKDDIHVTVTQNYFLKESMHDGATRTARLQINFTYTDPKIAFNVVNALGELIKQNELNERNMVAEQAVRETQLAIRMLSARLDELRQRLTRIRVRTQTASPHETARLQVETSQLRDTIAKLDQQRNRVLSEESELAIRKGMEHEKLLLRLDRTDSLRPPKPKLQQSTRLTIVALIVFVAFLPISGIAVAAFDPHIRTHADVTRLGLPMLIALESTTADDIATIERRLTAHRNTPDT